MRRKAARMHATAGCRRRCLTPPLPTPLLDSMPKSCWSLWQKDLLQLASEMLGRWASGGTTHLRRNWVSLDVQLMMMCPRAEQESTCSMH